MRRVRRQRERPGKYNVGGTLVALLFLGVFNSGLNLAGAPAYVASYVNGAALIAGIAWPAGSPGAKAPRAEAPPPGLRRV